MSDPAPDPWPVLLDWLPADDEPERPLMTLATVDADGWPNARTVLLSSVDERGPAFHADARSAKIAEADATGRAALTVHLPAQARQVVVQGTVEPQTRAEEQSAYARRSRYLQVLAWLNTPELAARPEAERVAAWARFEAEHPTLEAPPTWTGRRVRPERIVLWTGRPDACSRRVAYLRDGEGWRVEVRAG